jgi:hypothetical protein
MGKLCQSFGSALNYSAYALGAAKKFSKLYTKLPVSSLRTLRIPVSAGVELICVVSTASRFSSLSGAFACDSKKAFIPAGHSANRDFFCLNEDQKPPRRDAAMPGGP